MLRDIFVSTIGEIRRLGAEVRASFLEVSHSVGSPEPNQTRCQTIVEETLVIGQRLRAELAKTLLELSGKTDQSTATPVALESLLERIEWNTMQARRIDTRFAVNLRILVSEPTAYAMLFLRCMRDVDPRFRGGIGIALPLPGRTSIVELFRKRVSEDEWENALDGKAPIVADETIERLRDYAKALERSTVYAAPLPYTGPKLERR